MIIAFSPEQVHEVSQAFDAPWFFSESLYPTEIHKEYTGKSENKGGESSSYPTYIHKEKIRNGKATVNEDTKPAAKESPKKSSKKACNRKVHCSPYAFHPCHSFFRAARCAQQAANQAAKESAKTIELRTPIHYHDETPEVAKMSLDVTGFNSEEISVNVDDFVVSIKGKRSNRLGDVFILDRKFRLDKKTVNLDGVTASFEDGILELSVPKKATIGPRSIPISISSSAASTTNTSDVEEASNSLEEDNEVADKVEADEQLQSSDKNSPDEKIHDEHEHDSVEVKTVAENEINDDEEDGKIKNISDVANAKSSEDEAQNISDVANAKSSEDEAWEEVSEWSKPNCYLVQFLMLSSE